MSHPFLKRANAAPVYQLLGLVASSDEAGHATISLPFDEQITQAYGGVHGGILSVLADAAIGMAAATTLQDDESAATAQLSVSFLRPPGAEDMTATGRVDKRGRRLIFGHCDIHAGERLVAQATGIMAVSRTSRSSTE